MDRYTKNALWIYWTRCDDEVELTDEEFSDPNDKNLIEKDECWVADLRLYEENKDIGYMNVMCPQVLIGGNTQGECHVKMKKARGMGIFILESLSKKAQGLPSRMMGFTLYPLTMEAQMSQSRIATLAIRVRSFGDLTDENHYPIIGRIQGMIDGSVGSPQEARRFTKRL
ncbi:hypothetical protein Tco_0345161 [Tanacetum coccineum]